MRTLLIACFAVLISIQSALAECVVEGPPNIYLGNNGSYNVTINTKRVDTCMLSFSPLTPIVKFETTDIVVSARTGTLTKVPPFSYAYKAPPSGKADHFKLRICGRDERGQGCNVLNYAVSVQD